MAIGGLAQPAVLVRGMHHQASSHEQMATLAAQLGGPADLHTIDGSTHGVNITHATEVDAILREFLGGLPRT